MAETPITPKALSHLAYGRFNARNLAEARALAPSDPFTLADVDLLWRSLLAEGPAADDVDEAVFGVGAALGQLLVDELGMTWAEMPWDGGVELVVRGPGQSMVAPIAMAEKRWPIQEAGWIKPAYAMAQHLISGGPAPRKRGLFRRG